MNLLHTFINIFKNRNTLINIIYINVILFIAINLCSTFVFLLEINYDITSLLGVSPNIQKLSIKPWTIITYMFIHTDFWHITTNMIWLYFGGSIFIKYLTPKELWTTYILGGIFGGIVFIISFNIFPIFESIKNQSIAIGASASVLAVLSASATYVPNLSINLFGFGDIKLKYIAIIAILIDILSIPQGNSGGHIAHIGGALYGHLFISLKNKGFNISHIINNLLFIQPKQKKENRNESDYAYNTRKKKEEKKLNKILEKISLSGYDSLSSKEKEELFNKK